MKAAVKLCRRLSGCRAVTAEVAADFAPEAEYEWHFKTMLEPCVQSENSRTIEIPFKARGTSTVWPGPLPVAELQALKLQIVHEDPPVVRIENFLSELEIEHIKSLARPRFVKSTVGMTYEGGDSRTSETAWLNLGEDGNDETLRNITSRITQITRLQHENMEPFQVVRYQPGQFFAEHQDYLDQQEEQVCGGRIGTFFMYLNDDVEGGETHFPAWNLKIKPEKGLAILWWNVNYTALQEGQFRKVKDPAASHEALPVQEGEKWVVNRWLHPYDFLTPYFAGELR